MDEYQETISVSDLGIAAALVSAGHEIKRLSWGDSGRAIFIFEGGIEMLNVVKDFRGDKLMVNARTYFDSIKMLKGHIYSKR